MKTSKVNYHKKAAEQQNTQSNLTDESAKRNSPEESTLWNKTPKAIY